MLVPWWLAAQCNFKLQSSDPAGNPNFDLQKRWTQEVEKATNGQVEISISKTKWDALPKDVQAALTESARALAFKQIDALAAADLKAVEEAKAVGVAG